MGKEDFWSFIFLYATCMVCVWFLFSVNAMRTRKLSKVIDAKLEQLHKDVSEVKQYVYEAIENSKWTEEARRESYNGTNYLESSILAN